MTTRADILAAARALVGVPYRHGGRDHWSVDCYGFLVVACGMVGITLADHPTGYSRHQVGDLLWRYLRLNGEEVKNPEPGDVLGFWMRRSTGALAHLGILDQDSCLLHCCTKSRGVVKIPMDLYWKKRHLVSFRFRGVS